MIIYSTKKHSKYFIFTTLFLLLFFPLNTSEAQSLSYIYGKVVDSKNNTPLAYATVAVKNTSIGLITNSDGGFKIPAYYYTADATIVISFMGYYSEEIPVKELDRKDLNKIKLIQKTEFLNEVVIKRKENLTAKQIVELAIKNIENNYPQDQFSYVGYYRDYQQNKGNNYLNLNEAILQVHDLGFKFEDYVSTLTSILKYNRNEDFPRDSLAAKLYDYTTKTKVNNNAVLNHIGEQGNEFTLLRFHDAIRNYDVNTFDFVNNFNKDFVPNHNFYSLKETSINDEKLYQISFNRNLGKVLAEGKIYISLVDYKIYKLQYSVYKMKIKDGDTDKAHYVRRNKIRQKKEKLIYNIDIEYQDYQDIMYPKYISFINPFDVILPPKFYPTEANFLHEQKLVGTVSVSFEVNFNNKLSREGLFRKRNYSLTYKGDKIRIDSIRLHEFERKLVFYPRDKDMLFYKEVWIKGDTLPSKDFNFDVKNIKDIYGNVVNENEVQSYDQYREFFLLELNPKFKKPNDSLFMIKTRPIFRDQPILNLKAISRYWMNTPLKN